MRLSSAILLLIALQAQPQQSPTFRSGVQIVEVDVRVFDKDGRFVADLTADDFELVEEGTTQKIESVLLVGASSGDSGSRIGHPGSDRIPVPGPWTADRQTWIFLFDLNHLTPGGGFDRARKAVEDFLRDKWKEGDLAGVVAGSKMVNNRLTSVRDELVKAVKSIKPLVETRNRLNELTREWPKILNEDEALQIAQDEGRGAALERAVRRACAEEPDLCKPVPPDLQIMEKARRFVQENQRATMETLSAVNALAAGLAKMPGPKTIVLLSDGFITERLETTLQTIVGQTTRAGARIYAIDVRGLNRGRTAADLEQGVVVDEFGPVTRFDRNEDGPTSLSVDTGGLMIRNENNIGRALDRIAQDSGRYYVLAYAPVNATFDGKFRQIDVRVKRPGVRIRARRGYLALEPSRMLLPKAVTDAGAKSPGLRTGTNVGAENPDLRTETKATEPPPIEPEVPATTATGVVVARASDPKTTRLRPDADKVVEALAAFSKEKATAAANKGWDAYQRGDVESAVTLLGQAAAEPDARPWVLYALGLSQSALGRHEDAAPSWERVRQGAPDFAPVYSDLADTYLQLSEPSKALAVLRDGETRWPADTDILNAIGVVHARRGALDEAIVSFKKAAAAAPSDPTAYFNLGKAHELRYARSQRYVESLRTWVSSDEIRRQAEHYYQQCIKLGGPYALEAADAISRLAWSKR
jgi:VWFA-related protein